MITTPTRMERICKEAAVFGLVTNNMENQAIHFAVCLDNTDYPASLEVGKLYPVIPDEEAAAEGYLQIVDESGEAYAFLANRFHPVPLPPAVEQALLAASAQ